MYSHIWNKYLLIHFSYPWNKAHEMTEISFHISTVMLFTYSWLFLNKQNKQQWKNKRLNELRNMLILDWRLNIVGYETCKSLILFCFIQWSKVSSIYQRRKCWVHLDSVNITLFFFFFKCSDFGRSQEAVCKALSLNISIPLEV